MAAPPSTPPSRLFGDDYADPRSQAERDVDRAEVDVQVATLGKPPVDGDPEEQLLRRLLERRRRSSPGVIGGSPPLAVDVILGRAGTRALVVPGELLLNRRALRDASGRDVRRRLEQAGFVEREDRSAGDCDELTRVVARFVSEGTGSWELSRLVAELRSEGVPVSANHVTPLAAVVKGEGGPARTKGHRAFPGATYTALSDGPSIAVIDTGIAEEERGDGWLAHGRIERGPGNIDVLDAYPSPGNGFLDMASGHGTFVTGVVQQVCPTADVRVYRGPDSDGIASEMQVACAMVRAVRDGADIVNLSLGSQTVDGGPPIALSAALEVIADIERERGRPVLLIAAAGNGGDREPIWPAAFRPVVAVAGLTAKGAPAPRWSTHGPWVDCSAVGEGVVSTFLEGKEDPAIDTHDPDTFPADSWALWTGTSFAAPQVTGAVARLCQEESLSPREALARLLAAGSPAPDFGRRLRVLPGT